MSDDSRPVDDDIVPAAGADYLHSVILQAFFCGAYTPAIAFFIFISYKHQGRGRRWLTAIIVVQYCLIMTKVAYNCQELVQHFILESIEARLEAYFYPSILDMVLPDVCYFSAIIIPDILIIWRCWHVWNRNAYIASPLILLATTEAGLFTFLIYCNIVLAPAGPDEMLGLFEAGTIATIVSYVLTSSVTLAASALIVLRIYLIARMRGVRRHKLIIEVLIESALLYTIPLLVFTVLNHVLVSSVAAGVTSAVVIGMMGLAPLLLVTRIQLGLARPDASWAQPLSLMRGNKAEPKAIYSPQMQANTEATDVRHLNSTKEGAESASTVHSGQLKDTGVGDGPSRHDEEAAISRNVEPGNGIIHDGLGDIDTYILKLVN